MSDPEYNVLFNLYYASEGGYETGHSNVTVVKIENGIETSKTFAANSDGGSVSTWINPFDTENDGFVGVDNSPWRPGSSGAVSSEISISEADYNKILDYVRPYTGEDYSGRTPANYDVFASVNPFSPDSSWSCYSFTQSVYELVGGTGSTFVDEFSQTQLDQLTDNYIESFYGDADPGRILDNLIDYANGIADDYGWAWNNPGAVLGEILPSWIPSAWVPFITAPQQDSPLVLDLDSDGVELIALNTSDQKAFFDIDNDGFAEAVGWVAPDDGLLARDVNGNGKIDDATELFGSSSIDGFAILQELDSNGDLTINQYDTNFNELLIWQDANGDGISQSSELHNLAYYNIASIDLAGVAPSTQVIAGNDISHTSIYTRMDGSTGSIVDAWFDVDNTLSVYNQDYTLDIRTLFLPTLRGYGELPDLHIAMSLDNGVGGLLEMVQDFTTNFSLSDFADGANLRADIEAILFKWAKTTPMGQTFPDGSAAYAEEVQFLEKLFGEESESHRFNLDGRGGRVPGGSGRALAESFEIVYQNIAAHLLLQVGAKEIFENDVFYNFYTGEVEGDLTLSQAGIDVLEVAASQSGVDAQSFWVTVAEFLNTVKGYNNFTALENQWMNSAIVDSNPTLDWQEIKDLTAFEYQPSTIFGTNGDDILTGTAGDNIIQGYTGNDVIDGKEGNDVLRSYSVGPVTSEDDATYIGGEGDDYVDGGQGNDIYVYTSGDDLYTDLSGNDTVQFLAGVTFQDLTFYVKDYYNLLIDVNGLGSIEIQDQFTSMGRNIETLKFSDNSTFNLSTINNLLHYGSDGSETIYGVSYNANQDEFIYGFDGDDVIYNRNGNDYIDGGAGNDQIIVDGGNVTILASAGFDTIDAASGYETILIPEAYSSSDISFLQVANSSGQYNDLEIIISGLGQIKVVRNFNNSTLEAIDEIAFENGDPSIILDSSTVYQINGTAGNDTISMGSGYNSNNIFRFGTGQDTVSEYSGTDTLLFGAGYSMSNIILQREMTGSSWSTHDNLLISDNFGNKTNFFQHFASGTKQLEYLEFNDGTIVSVAGLEIASYGSENADNISGLETGDLTPADLIYGYGGNDTITGQSGDDIVYAGIGNDYVLGGVGNDILFGEQGADSMYGGLGDDLIYGGDDNDILAGDDTFPSSSMTGNDTIYGGTGDDTVSGGRGDDTLYGDEGNDSLNGNDGNDTLYGGLGNDQLNGDVGTDTASYADITVGGVSVSLALTTLQNTLNAGSDTLLNIENLVGTAFADTLLGNTAANVLSGGAGADTLKGQDGNDTLYGGAGVDYLEGNNGNDLLYGGEGADTLKGSSGTDTFVYLSVSETGDTIQDFNTTAGEKIDLTAILQNSVGFVGTQAFTSGFLRAAQNGTSANIYLDVDGSAGSGAEVILATLQNITSSNITLSSFILPVIGASNTAPVAGSDSATTNEDTAVTIGVLSNDTDANGDALTVSVLTNAAKGSLVVNANNTITYTPNANTNGADSFTYQVNDGHGGTASATVSLTVTPVNDAPVATNDNATTNEDTAVTITVLSNDTDAENNTLSVSVVGNAAAGSLVVNANNTITYTPNANANGSDSFTYQVNDGNGGTSNATVFLTVTPVNDAPLAFDDVFSGTQNLNITGNLLVNNGNGADSDIDGNALSVTAQTLTTAHGSVVISSNGGFVYTPTAGYSGTDSFTYTVSDGAGGSDTGAVSITLAPASGIYGTTGNDTITGTASDDVIYGLAGNDTLYGEVGNDTLYGDAGADTLKGRDGNDIMYGGADVDYLEGGNGDDILFGGLGADTLKGSAGVDTFAFQSMSEAGDIIQDYNYSAVEKIDISDLLSAYDPLTEAITDFVQITQSGVNSILSVDIDGGANSFVQLATLNSTSGLTDEAALVASGRLIVV